MHQSGRPEGPALSQVAPAGYRLLELLGRGGMGEVYLADDLTLGRKVAIKFLLPDRTADPDARRRLLREAQAAAAVEHPGICTVFETGETSDGRAYVVMQYVEGETLAAALRRGPLPVRDALKLAADLAEALKAAHQRGIVHRDLKPANVMIPLSGPPKLLDLGIAKVVVSDPEASGSPTVSGATEAGILIGTPGYMAPEQIQQRPLDGRCDLFALGAVLFECLTGRLAFRGSTPLETIGNTLHVAPPLPSTLRPELTPQHDELCRRLLAKTPDERLQSADEVLGAIRMLLPDAPRPVMSRRVLIWAAAAMLAVLAVGWFATRPRPLPEAPADATVWYRRGTESIREGSYLSARRALEQAVAIFPDYVLAYARLAEASTELDDEASAQQQLLQVSQRVSNEARLPDVERLRLQALRALVLRDITTCIERHRELVTRAGQDAGAWLDLGRAQEAGGFHAAAVESYGRAIAQDASYAAAYLRLGNIRAFEARPQEALEAFRQAERLYRAASDVEGETEVLLRRGATLDAFGELKAARIDLERARVLAADRDAVYQQVRIALTLSSVTASEGQFETAAQIASAAVQQATNAGLHTIAADGLIDLTATLMQQGRLDDAAVHVNRAIALAEQRGARRTLARARVQLAALHQYGDEPTQALTQVDAVLPFLKENNYRRFELVALSVAARAHERLDDLERARIIASQILSVADGLKDEAQIAVAASGLASVTSALGEYPEALRLRERAEAIRRKQGDTAALPFDLANRAELLIRLGRGEAAGAALSELEAGIASKLESYVGRRRRAEFLRALAAATELQCADALQLVERLENEGPSSDSPGTMARAIGAYCAARQKRKPPSPGRALSATERILARERQYWLAAAAFERGEPQAALIEVRQGFELLGKLPNDELGWRLAAIGAAAAGTVRNEVVEKEMRGIAQTAFERIRAAWKGDFASYEQRPDLVALRKRAGLG
jgi:tetratricopeptide (TPR) repeat protein